MKKLLGHTTVVAAGFLVALTLAAGCRDGDEKAKTKPPAPAQTATHQEADDDHPSTVPQDYTACVDQLRQHYQLIKQAFEQDNIEEAHEPLHGIGGLLAALPKLAGEADLSEADRAAVETAVTDMFDAYGSIDGALHDNKPPDYAAVSEKIDAAMKAIDQVKKTP